MAIVQDRSLRKPSGARNTSTRTKRVHMLGSNPLNTTIGNHRKSVNRVRGGIIKVGLLSTDVVNLFVPSENKHVKAKLVAVKENTADTNFVRRNIITKSAKIETDKGLAVVTNRPGQQGNINAVLLEEKKN